MKILLDENLPHQLRLEIQGHEVFTTAYMNWSGIENGELLKVASDAGFDVLITNDRGLEYEQNLQVLLLGIIVLIVKSNTIESIRPLFSELHEAIANLKSGQLIKLTK